MVNFGIDHFLFWKYSFPVLYKFDCVDKRCAAFCFIFHIFACCMKKIHCFTNYTYFCFWQCPVMIWVIPLFVYIAIYIAQLAWRLLFVTFRGICNVRGQGHCSIVFEKFSVRKVRWLILASWIFFFTLLRINIELLLLLLSIMVTFTTNICVLNRQWFEWHKVKFANI